MKVLCLLILGSIALIGCGQTKTSNMEGKNLSEAKQELQAQGVKLGNIQVQNDSPGPADYKLIVCHHYPYDVSPEKPTILLVATKCAR